MVQLYTANAMKKATITLLMSVAFSYLYCANFKDMSNIKKSNHFIHGESASNRTKEYLAWKNIRKRCYNINYEKYHRYGGRGITVCDRWLNSYSNFLEDVGRAPSQKHSLDRINNDGNYEPGNVRWITQKEQCNNRRDNVRISYSGKEMTLKQWAEFKGINYGTLYSRLYRNNWTIERALT